jgi:hypothetical protein
MVIVGGIADHRQKQQKQIQKFAHGSEPYNTLKSRML